MNKTLPKTREKLSLSLRRKTMVITMVSLIIASFLVSAFAEKTEKMFVTVDAGDDIYLNCSHEPFTSVTLDGSATGHLYVMWETNGDGYFYDPTDPKTEYYFGTNDLTGESVTLTLTAYGNYGTEASDNLKVYFPKQLIKMEPLFFYTDTITSWEIDTVEIEPGVFQSDTIFITEPYDTISINTFAISSYFDFAGKTIEQVLAPIESLVSEVYDENGPVNLNDEWNPRSAYRLKASDTCCFGIYSGEPVFDRRFVLEPGNNYYIPVLCERPVSLVELFGNSAGDPIQYLYRIDDFAGNTTYPQIDSVTGQLILANLFIDTLFPGRGYELSVSNTIEFVFPGHIDLQCPEDAEVNFGDTLLLEGGQPSTGIYYYTGPGVFETNGNYYFTAATDSTSFGSYDIQYCYQNPETGTIGCCTFTIDVGMWCANDTTVEIGSTFPLTKSLPTGGTYSGNGVSFINGNYHFNSLEAGFGSHTIEYSKSDTMGRVGICNFNIKVRPIQFLCKDTIACFNERINLNYIQPQGGTFSGNFIYQDDNGYYFEADWEAYGNFPIQYNYTNQFGYSASCTFNIYVKKSDFFVGFIPDQTVWHNDSLIFEVKNCGKLDNKYSIVTPDDVNGYFSIDSIDGIFKYIPDETDKQEFEVTFIATDTYGSIEQTVTIIPKPILPPEEDVLLLGNAKEMPQEDEYDIHTYQSDGNKYFNAILNRPVEKHTLIGKTIVLEAGNSAYRWYDTLNNRPDISKIEIYAERLIIKDEFWLPQTEFIIKTRYLEFVDIPGHTPARLKNEPLSDITQPGFQIKGIDGNHSGNMTIIADSISFPDNKVRFITNGGNGQQGGKGKNGKKQGEDLVVVGNNRFTNCSQLNSFLANHPLSSEIKTKGVRVSIKFRDDNWWGWNTYEVCQQKYFNGQWLNGYVSGTNYWANVTLRNKHKNGTNAQPGGYPGEPGNAGKLISNLNLTPYLVSQGGKAGNNAGYYTGGAPIEPQTIMAVGMTLRTYSSDKSPMSIYYHESHPGTSTWSPNANHAHGTNGQAIQNGSLNWINPYALDQILRYCKRAYQYGSISETRVILVDYTNLLGEYLSQFPWISSDDYEKLEVNQIYLEMQQMLENIDSNIDYYGNPFGWVPMLSYETHYKAYSREIDRAVGQVYLSRWLTNVVNGKTKNTKDKLNTIDSLATELKKEIANVFMYQYEVITDETDGKIIEIENELDIINAKTDSLIYRLDTMQTNLFSMPNNQHKRADWKKRLGTLVPLLKIFPMSHPFTGVDGKGLSYLSKGNLDDPVGTLSGIPSIFEMFQDSIDYKEVLDDYFSDAEVLYNYVKNKNIETISIDDPDFSNLLEQVANNTRPTYEALVSVTNLIKENEAPRYKIDEEIARLLADDSTFLDITKDVKHILDKKESLARMLFQSLKVVKEIENGVSRNFLTLNRLNEEVQNTKGRETYTFLYPRTIQYLQSMENRSLERLDKYYYYFTKAYEYRFLEPYMRKDVMKLFQNATDSIMNNSPATTGEQFEFLKEIFLQELDIVNMKILDDQATSGNREYEVTEPNALIINLSQSQLSELNNTNQLQINMVEEGHFLFNQTNVKIIDIHLDENGNGINVLGNPPNCSPYGVQFVAQHEGISKYISYNGEIMLFKHYNNQFDSFGNQCGGYYWVFDCYPQSGGQIETNNHNETIAGESLLRTIMELPEATNIYSRPGAFSDITITANHNDLPNCPPRIVFTNLRLRVEYSYFFDPAKPISFNSVFIHPNIDELNPYYSLDLADKNNRKDGRGNFMRFYNNSTNSLTVSAPKEYGNYVFQNWVRTKYGYNGFTDTIQASEVTITLNSNYQLVSNYARIQPKLLVLPDTITMNFEAGSDTIAIKNIGTGEMEWFAENENDWISILNNPDGIDDYNLLFSVSTNYSDTTRIGKIYVYANESLNFADSVVIVQPPTEYMVTFSLPKGWAGISTWLDPLQSEVVNMFAPIENDLVILKNQNSVYWPDQGINTIQNWDITNGYMIKMDKTSQLVIPGTQSTQHQVNLDAGWELIPVLTDCNVLTAELLQNANFTIIKEVAGTNMYWPQFGINTLEYLQPGKSYFLLLNSGTTLNYGECKQYKLSVNVENTFNKVSPWNMVEVNPISHVLALPKNNADFGAIETGNIIGVFNSANQCCGYAVVGSDYALTVFFDDHTTEQKEGLTENEELRFRMYDNNSKLSYHLYATYDQMFAANDGKFASNGLSAITGLKIGDLVIDEYSLKAVEFFPNPVQDIININNVLPLDVKFEIKNLKGSLILAGKFTEGINQVDMSLWDSGVYLVTLIANESSLTNRIVKY